MYVCHPEAAGAVEREARKRRRTPKDLSFPSCVESTGFQPESRMLRSFGVLRHLRLRLRASGSLRMTAVSSPELRYEREVRKVSVPPFDLQSVPDVRALGAVECDEIDGQVDRAGVRPVDECDELERGRILLAELGQEVRLDHAGADHVFDDVDIAAADIDPAQEVDLHRRIDLRVRDVADDVDEAVAGLARNAPQQIGDKT